MQIAGTAISYCKPTTLGNKKGPAERDHPMLRGLLCGYLLDLEFQYTRRGLHFGRISHGLTQYTLTDR